MTKYVIMDYDGFVCKAFYAAQETRGVDPDPEKVFMILERLEQAAIDKAHNLFQGSEIKVRKYMSMHSYKKDLYPDYKAGRKKNELLGDIRKAILNNEENHIIKVQGYEADDLIVAFLTDFDRLDNTLVVSDDKDIKCYAKYLSGINIDSPVYERSSEQNIEDQAILCLMGDKEDNISGIPKVGVVRANEIFETVHPTDIQAIANIYKTMGVSFSDCLKNLYLITPVTTNHRDIIAWLAMEITEVYANG